MFSHRVGRGGTASGTSAECGAVGSRRYGRIAGPVGHGARFGSCASSVQQRAGSDGNPGTHGNLGIGEPATCTFQETNEGSNPSLSATKLLYPKDLVAIFQSRVLPLRGFPYSLSFNNLEPASAGEGGFVEQCGETCNACPGTVARRLVGACSVPNSPQFQVSLHHATGSTESLRPPSNGPSAHGVRDSLFAAADIRWCAR